MALFKNPYSPCVQCLLTVSFFGWHYNINLYHLTTFCLKYIMNILIQNTTFNNGSLGSRIDEERSEMRYVMWIAEFSESSNLWTHIALSGIPKSMLVWVSVNTLKISIYCNRMWTWVIPTTSIEIDGLLEMQCAAGHSSELKAYLFSPRQYGLLSFALQLI